MLTGSGGTEKRYLTSDMPGEHYIIPVNHGNRKCLGSISIRHLIVRSHKFSKARGYVLKWLQRSQSDGCFDNIASHIYVAQKYMVRNVPICWAAVTVNSLSTITYHEMSLSCELLSNMSQLHSRYKIYDFICVFITCLCTLIFVWCFLPFLRITKMSQNWNANT